MRLIRTGDPDVDTTALAAEVAAATALDRTAYTAATFAALDAAAEKGRIVLSADWPTADAVTEARELIAAATAGLIPIDATVPGLPAGAGASPSGSALAVTWAAPESDGGMPVIGYRVYREGVTDAIGTVPAGTTSFTAAGLVPGSTHRFAVSAVNVLGEGAPSEWSAPAMVPDGAARAPARAVLSHDNGWDTGLQDGAYNVRMNLWSGQNGSSFRLYENGSLIATIPLAYGSTAAQTAVVPVTGKVNGTYVYTGELVNSKGTTAVQPATVTVSDAGQPRQAQPEPRQPRR